MSGRFARVRWVAAVVAAGWTVACGAADEFEPELAQTTEPIIQATSTLEAPWSVRLRGDTDCTAEAVSRHWLLTAAHCLFNKPAFASNRSVTAVNPTTGLASVIFTGGARYILHPDYVHESSDRVHDLALVQLDGNGVELPSYSRLYRDARQPWTSGYSGSRKFEVAGFGMGGDPGGVTNCESGAIGTKRLGTAFELNGRFLPSGGPPSKVTGRYLGAQQLCDGDSGSPWMLRRGHTLMQFAVHSGSRGAVSGDKAATLVQPKMNWIYNETFSRKRPLECLEDSRDGFKFLGCQTRRVKIWVEAEDAQLIAPMAVGRSGNASRSRVVTVPSSTTSAGGSARLSVNLPETDRYFIWLRASAPAAVSNAFTVAVDGGTRPLPVAVSTTGAFQWSQLKVGATPVGFDLGPGDHTIDIGRSLAGAQLDQLLITSDPNFQPFDSFIEAESGTLVSPMTFVPKLPLAVVTTYGTGFIRAPNGSGPGGVAIYTFNVPARSDYIVWGRTSSSAPDHDGFRVMFDADSDNDDWVWQTQAANGWVWNMVTGVGRGPLHVMLDPGSHWMAVKQDETGTALDRLFISNNPYFVPADAELAPIVIGGVLTTNAASGTATTTLTSTRAATAAAASR